jgi:hypothetical protein
MVWFAFASLSGIHDNLHSALTLSHNSPDALARKATQKRPRNDSGLILLPCNPAAMIQLI